MRKQTHMVAILAAILLALIWLASAGKLHAASETLSNVVPFTATTGLESLPAYRMDFAVNFDGTRQGRPTSGDMAGTLEATNDPDAQHLKATLKGYTASQFGLPETVELYQVNDGVYFQSPQDGAWIGVPGRMVSRYLPDGIPAPEDYVELPVTAVRQPGQRMVDGVVTQRYTFGRENLADGRNYKNAEGTIWVAVEGDYVVRYEATFSGRHENLAAGGVQLLDNGTISVVYELSDVDDDLIIEAPKGARGLGLRDLLMLSGMRR